eukprot:gb/GFBE01007299.1/.p1 GENE.gb/GFBE01007299.1/~~gb/GFBE01007299.1/.p1  ORF type:complete len:1082 (+),score=165.65 gb/GFBE01007299.1/:1-3246(+)
MARSCKITGFICAVTLCAAASSEPGALQRRVWRAPVDNPHLRRLQENGEVQQYTVTVNVVKKDSFGKEPSRVDVSFIPPGHDQSELVQASFAGTGGNAGKNMPMGVLHGSVVNITGYKETNSIAASALKQEMRDSGMALTIAGTQQEETDKRPVFVVSELLFDVPAGDRRLAGTMPRVNTAVIVLYEPCGNTLPAEVTKEYIEEAFFSEAAGAFREVMTVCSRGTVTFSGSVIGPISGCPANFDPMTLYYALNTQLKDDAKWYSNYHKMIVLPEGVFPEVGLGTIGGSISWYGAGYLPSATLFLHELGHNFKLHHAAGPFTNQEYADLSSAMGYCCTTRCFNFIHSWQLGFAEFQTSELSLSDITSKATSTKVALFALGTSVTSGVKIRTGSRRLQDLGMAAQPSFLVLSYRGVVGSDEYLGGTEYANKVQVHHWDGDSREHASFTFLLHSVEKGATTLIQDTDRQGTRSLTDLKMTVKGQAGGASNVVEVLLCKRQPFEDAARQTFLSPCSDPGGDGGGGEGLTTSQPGVSTFRWVRGAQGQDCGTVCRDLGLTCDSTKPSGLTTNELVSDAFQNAGYSCKSFHRPCDYPGSPFSTGRDDGDCAPITANGNPSSCSENQEEDHYPLCYCKSTGSGQAVTGPWSDYFDDQESSLKIPAGTAIVGVGVKGVFGLKIRVSHRTDVKVSDQGVTEIELSTGVGTLYCQLGQVVTQITCAVRDCSRIRLHCATPTTGEVRAQDKNYEWLPEDIHTKEDVYCPDGTVLAGMQCSSRYCGTKTLVCYPFESTSTCVPSCNRLGLECGDDGCGGSCGTCSPAGGFVDFATPACSADAGRCMYMVSSAWSASGKPMGRTNLVAAGMGCQGKYCEEVRLYLLSVSVDAFNLQNSSWISDNVGHRWPWNSGESASDQVADCPEGKAVTLVECSGKKCDNLRLHCSKPLQWSVDLIEDPVVTDWFSDEDGGRMDCPDGKVVTGVECKALKPLPCVRGCNDYCDNKRLRCRTMRPEMAGSALRFAAAGDVQLPPGVEPAPRITSTPLGEAANASWIPVSGAEHAAVSAACMSMLCINVLVEHTMFLSLVFPTW